jgi:hypothetical protein
MLSIWWSYQRTRYVSRENTRDRNLGFIFSTCDIGCSSLVNSVGRSIAGLSLLSLWKWKDGKVRDEVPQHSLGIWWLRADLYHRDCSELPYPTQLVIIFYSLGSGLRKVEDYCYYVPGNSFQIWNLKILNWRWIQQVANIISPRCHRIMFFCCVAISASKWKK